jgi:signal transduction histidine kinase
MDTGAPAWRGRPSAADLAIAAASTTLGVIGVMAEVLASGRSPHLLPGGIALAVLASAGLVWRRRAPVPVALVVAASCLLYHLLGYPGLAPAVAMYPAAYTVAAYGQGWRFGPALALMVVIRVVPLIPPMPAAYDLGGRFGQDVGMIVVVAMGEAARARWKAAAEQLRAVRRGAAEQGRRRLVEQRLAIAREVHDVLAHTVTVISVQAAAASEALDGRPRDAREALAQVRRAAREASAELRGTLHLLRDEADGAASAPANASAPGGLAGPIVGAAPQPALAQLPGLVHWAGTAGIEVALRVSGDPGGCSPAQELVVYRVVQEALTNAMRHSPASAVHVDVWLRRDEIQVEVTDDGAGRPAGALPSATPAGSTGHGLVGMRERLEAVDGSLDAGPLPAGGFRVLARLPLDSDADSDADSDVESDVGPAGLTQCADTAVEARLVAGADPAPGGAR